LATVCLIACWVPAWRRRRGPIHHSARGTTAAKPGW